MFMRATAWIVAFAAALFIACHEPAAAQGAPEADSETREAAHAGFLADAAMQTERPEADPEETEPRPDRDAGWLEALARAVGAFLTALGPLFRLLFYLMIAGIALAILYFVFGEALNLRFDRKPKDDARTADDVVEDFRPDASAARSLLEEADALAKAGRFAEAVHLLLFRSIQDIQTKSDGGVPRSLTAREIGGLSSLPERPKKALSPIIAIVERSFFGGRAVDEDGWRSARASYEDFAFGEAWS